MKRNIFATYPNLENQTEINTSPFQEQQIAYVLLHYKVFFKVLKIQNLHLNLSISPRVCDLNPEIQL